MRSTRTSLQPPMDQCYKLNASRSILAAAVKLRFGRDECQSGVLQEY